MTASTSPSTASTPPGASARLRMRHVHQERVG
jgi:hypothetical protein